ncbi:helix-turn-helix transcriptional regulator [Pantoea ananatis]|uniref:helix-turn-helix transcriptional regulator n=1 Tax=Pantoea ananas TaxID=553 RepID=UPI000B7D20AE|nr:helix-turn-helix transcriptional regulator [Pantoea ananatis]
MNTLSKRVKQCRLALNLSQAQLAKKVGMSQQSMHAIEAGEIQRPRLILELAKELNCDPNWLVYGEGNAA